jgi:hypothetical protein
MNAENRFLFSSGIVFIFVVRHAANNKQLEIDKCLCVLLSREYFYDKEKKNNITSHRRV